MCRWWVRAVEARDEAAQPAAAGRPRRRVDGRLVVLLVVVALASRGTLTGSLNPVALRTWATVSREAAALVWDRALAVHRPQLSHAMVDVDSGSWLAAEELPAAAKTAASRLRQLAADAQRGHPGSSGPVPTAWSAST